MRKDKKKTVHLKKHKTAIENTVFVKEKYNVFETKKEGCWKEEDFRIYKTGEFFFIAMRSLVEDLKYNYYILFPIPNEGYTLAEMVNVINFCLEFNYITTPIKNKREILNNIDIKQIIIYTPQQVVFDRLKKYLRVPKKADVDEVMMALKYYL